MAYLIPGTAKRLPAETPRDLIFFLMGSSRVHCTESLTSFMAHFASSFQDFSGGHLLSIQTPDAFVAGLLRHGWLQQA
jgi:hypothetical protein